jgi:hypothetical protein
VQGRRRSNLTSKIIATSALQSAAQHIIHTRINTSYHFAVFSKQKSSCARGDFARDVNLERVDASICHCASSLMADAMNADVVCWFTWLVACVQMCSRAQARANASNDDDDAAAAAALATVKLKREQGAWRGGFVSAHAHAQQQRRSSLPPFVRRSDRLLRNKAHHLHPIVARSNDIAARRIAVTRGSDAIVSLRRPTTRLRAT